MSKTCPDCGDGFENLGTHITLSNCEYPDLTSYQLDILIGTTMGDAHIRPDGMWEICVKKKEYLLDILKELPEWFTTKSGVHPVYTEKYESENMWRLRSVSTDETMKLRESWYPDGEKVFPIDNIELNGTVLSHWYATDGGIDGRDRACFYSSNESTKGLRDWLKSEGFDCCCDDRSIRMNNDGEEKLFKVAQPKSGYEYKWPDRYK